MKSKLINIGNSKSIILPSSIIKQCGFDDKVNLVIKDNTSIISKPKKTREGWEQTFIEASAGNEEHIFENMNNKFDEDEWTW